jgi:hypothetical protein
MISSLFGKTKPVIYIILLGFLFIFYCFVHFVRYGREYSPEQLVLQLFLLGLLCFSVFLVNFIVKRNQITGTNSFAMLYFVLLIVLFPEVLLDGNAICCNFFLLLASRRLVSLKSLRAIKHKIFDATLWIVVASLFYDWALLYLAVVFIAIYFYEPKNIRNWLVPLSGVAAVVLIANAFLVVVGLPEFFRDHYTFSLSLDRDFSTLWDYSTKLLMYAALIIITGFLAFVKMGKLGLGRIITVRLVAISITIGLIVTFLKTNEMVFPVLITFFPAATLITKYVEVIRRPKVKEIVLLASIVFPFLALLLRAF